MLLVQILELRGALTRSRDDTSSGNALVLTVFVLRREWGEMQRAGCDHAWFESLCAHYKVELKPNKPRLETVLFEEQIVERDARRIQRLSLSDSIAALGILQKKEKDTNPQVPGGVQKGSFLNESELRIVLDYCGGSQWMLDTETVEALGECLLAQEAGDGSYARLASAE